MRDQEIREPEWMNERYEEWKSRKARFVSDEHANGGADLMVR
jgi:hypothetical protein